VSRRLFVLVGRHIDVEAVRQAHALGEARDDSPYGLSGLEALGWQVSWSAPSAGISFVARVLRRILGFDLVHAWRQRAAVRDADVLYAHEDHDSLALCLAARLGRNTRALCPNVIWVATRWPAWGPLRRLLVRHLLAVAPRVVVNSTSNVAALRGLGLPPAAYVRFGVEPVSAPSAPPASDEPAPDLLIVGNDPYRDWHLLQQLTDRLTDLRVLLVTGRPPQFVPGPHCAVRAVRDPQELAWLYAHSGACLVPLTQNFHASGVTVVLESLMAGARVVVTDTGGLRDYATSEQVSFVPVGDEPAFEAETRRLLAGDRQPGPVEVDQEFTRAAFLRRLSQVFDEALALRAPNSRPARQGGSGLTRLRRQPL